MLDENVIPTKEEIDNGMQNLTQKSKEEINLDKKVESLNKFHNEEYKAEFDGFDTKTFLWKHKVTGDEMNEYHEEVIQKGFEKVYDRENRFAKELTGIYKVIDTLHKEYLPWIGKSLKLGRKATEEARIAQKNTEKNLEIQKKSILKIKEFKDKIEDMHLEEKISNLIDKLESLEDEHNENIRVLVAFRTKLEAQKHLYQIDQTWENAQNNKEQLSKVNKTVYELDDEIKSQKGSMSEFGRRIHSAEGKINAQEAAISDLNRRIRSINDTIASHKDALKELQEEKEKLQQIKHLTDVDSMWSQLQTAERKMEAVDLENEKRDDAIKCLNEKAESQELKSNELLAMIMEEQENNKKLVSKLKLAYVVAGASAAVAIVNLILSVIGIV